MHTIPSCVDSEHKTAGGPPDCTGKEGVVEARRGNRGRISTTSDPGKRGQ